MGLLKTVAVIVVLVVALLVLLSVFHVTSWQSTSDTTVQVLEGAVVVVLAGIVIGALAKK